MSKTQAAALPCSFNGSVRIEGRPDRLTSDAGVLALRELDERLGLTAWVAERLLDPRDPRFVVHPMDELLRTRLYLMAGGRRHQDHADRLRHDAACRLAVSVRRGLSPLEVPDDPGTPDGLASQPTQSRLIETLGDGRNRAVLQDALFESARRHALARPGGLPKNVTMDVDSKAFEVYGYQAGSAYNGHYQVRCYHPIATMLAETADWVAAELRPGNVHTAHGAIEHLLPAIERVETSIAPVEAVRGDAGFPSEELLAALEARRIHYCFRLKDNAVLARLADPYFKRPVGRPPNEPREWTHELAYQAESWSKPRRLVLVVVERWDQGQGELFLDYFFLVTSWNSREREGVDVLAFYRQRGTMEGHLGEFSSVLAPALSCTSRPKSHVRGKPPKETSEPRDAEAANAATFLLYGLAYNLANAARGILNREAPRKDGSGWHLVSLRECLLAVAARVVVSARRATVILQEHVADLWQTFWRGLDRLRPVTTPRHNSS
jgi:hypothetical protein